MLGFGVRTGPTYFDWLVGWLKEGGERRRDGEGRKRGEGVVGEGEGMERWGVKVGVVEVCRV